MSIEEGVALSRYTTLGTGGPAKAFARPESVAEVEELLRWAAERELAGRDGRARLEPARRRRRRRRARPEARRALAEVGVEGELLRAGGGAANAVGLHRARAAGLGGFEFACAIPGTTGGGIWMNAGAYAGEFSHVLVRALVATAEGTGWLTPAELGLSYRHSNLRHGQVVVQAELRLQPRPPAEIKAEVAELNARRKAAQPTNKRTFGSVFKNPEHELSAGRMLEACGLKGIASAGRRSPRSMRTSSRTRAERRASTRSP